MAKSKLYTFLTIMLVALTLFGCTSTGADTNDTAATVAETISTEPYWDFAEETETTATSSTIAPETTIPETAASVSPDSSFEVHYIDVGQGDASLVICDDEVMLIDGGDTDASQVMYTYLQKNGIDEIDYLICTHAHADHVGGLSGALTYATVTGTAYCSVTSYSTKAFTNFVSVLERQGQAIVVPEPGDTFELGSATCTILGPISESDEPNNTSIALRVDYGETSFLFAGDAEVEEENEILDAGYDVSCTVMQVNHHGSDTSTGYRWLREAAPEYAVISCGTGNSYGHPTENCLSKLRDADVTVFRTDMQGDIICYSDGTNVSFAVDRNADADTLSGAGAGGNHTDSEEKTKRPLLLPVMLPTWRTPIPANSTTPPAPALELCLNPTSWKSPQHGTR